VRAVAVAGVWFVAVGLAVFIAGSPGSGGGNKAGAGCGLLSLLLAASAATAVLW
jgi:hypothetical protein